MTVQPDLCRTCSETTLLVFPTRWLNFVSSKLTIGCRFESGSINPDNNVGFKAVWTAVTLTNTGRKCSSSIFFRTGLKRMTCARQTRTILQQRLLAKQRARLGQFVLLQDIIKEHYLYNIHLL